MIKQVNNDEFRGLGWHKHVGQYIIKSVDSGFSFNLTHTPSGCGSLIMSQYYTSLAKESEKIEYIITEFNKLTEDIKSNGVGSIITTVGENWYNFKNKEFFDKLGFKQVAEYNNYRHSPSGNYKQFLLIKYL